MNRQENDMNAQQSAEMERLLGLAQSRGAPRVRLVLLALAVIVALLSILYWISARDTDGVRFVTQTVGRGDLAVKVTATGNLEPTNLVEVGVEVSGTIASVDIDFNDRVTRGQVLARLDTDQLEARVRQSNAALALARAAVAEARATLGEARNHAKRYLALKEKGLCSAEDCESAQAASTRAEAALDRARAQVTQAQAQLDSDRTSLNKAVIRSPIDGIVLKRDIEPGQTVAASLQTPVLFTLAEDLAQMDLRVDVDEADVGQVREGQTAVFTVDAYPDKTFSARIRQVRYGSKEVDGVISYETLLSVDNSELLLRPGMTATAEILVKEVTDVLLVPNVALRFSPPPREARERGAGAGLVGALLPRMRRSNSKQRATESGEAARQRVWVLRNGEPVRIPLTAGATDGAMTQVLAGDLEPGMDVLVDTLGGAR
jgi:HlyD family secretion protein